MKKIILTIVALLTLTIVHGQSTEYRISLNSGLFSFAGKSASEVSVINAGDASTPGSTNNVYGSKNGLCYGLSANIQRVTKRNFILGVDAGYEVLRSKISISGVWLSGDPSPYGVPATGQTFLNNNFVNIFPFLGYRIMAKPITLDITAGLDLAHCFKSQEKGNATDSQGTKYESSGDIKTIQNDVRPRIQLSAGYKKVGAYVGYSYGLTSYMNDYIGIPNESYPRLLRFGLTYQIK
ncbi:MAG: hypothetical protein ACM3O8_00675 [Methylococcaceae bacterium]